MHSFTKKVVHAEELLSGSTLKDYIKKARKLSATDEAIYVFHAGNYKEYMDNDSWSPAYFGGAGELLCETFFEEFGHLFNVADIRSVDDFDNAEIDSGVDHYAVSIKEQKYKKSNRKAILGSPVYIQTKFSMNSSKEYTTNDGSRLPNFFMNAQVKALQASQCYQARYIIFTTGKGLHYKLKNNSGDIAEVINFNKIKKLVDNNEIFWNKMRAKCSVKEVPIIGKMDPEARCILDEN